MSLTPIFGILVGYIIISIIILGEVCFKQNKTRYKIINLIRTGIRGCFFSIFAYFGLLYWDTFLKIIILGIITYSNIFYHLGAIILMIILGTVLLLMAVFIAPTLKTLIIFGFTLGISIFLLWFETGNEILASEERYIIYYPLGFILLAAIVIELLWDIISILLKRNPFENKKLWDITNKKIIKRFFNLKFYILLWLLFSIEFILKMEGMGVLFWI